MYHLVTDTKIHRRKNVRRAKQKNLNLQPVIDIGLFNVVSQFSLCGWWFLLIISPQWHSVIGFPWDLILFTCNNSVVFRYLPLEDVKNKNNLRVEWSVISWWIARA